MIECIFSIDYEIYGNGEGSLSELVHEPTSQLMSVFKQWNSTFVVFAEALEFRKIEEYQTDKGISNLRAQLRQLLDEGFEIGLHLHPWWFNAQRERGRWRLDWSERNLCAMSEQRVEEVVGSAIEYLRKAMGTPSFTPLSFRSGLWLMQPTKTMARVLSRHGVQIDSSVFKGGRIRDVGLDYRPALGNGYYWRFADDVNSPDPHGTLLELPIHTEMVPFWRMMSVKRLGLHRKVPSSGNGGPLANRLTDFVRLRYPRKLDFCRMRLDELRSVIDALLHEEEKDSQTYKPIVAIGHTKDLTDFETVRQLLSYLASNGIAVTNFKEVFQKLTPRGNVPSPKENDRKLSMREVTSGIETRTERPSIGACTSASKAHISVCVCTFKRPALLAELLRELLYQATEERFTYSIVVVDNDSQGSARDTVERFQREHTGMIRYVVEPRQSIAIARNRTITNATGDLVAFIDDDEVPVADWLLKMYTALLTYNVDGVLGPVESRFTATPPEWMIKAGIFERPNGPGYETGTVLDWKQTGTGNVLLRRGVLDEVEGPFREEFGSGGEDLDFFRRAMARGKVFVWCDEAIAYEIVPPERTRLLFQLRRALLRGKVSLAQREARGFGILKSLAASGLYTILLPLLLVIGRPLFVKYLIKDFDHIGKLLALCRITTVRQKYVVE